MSDCAALALIAVGIGVLASLHAGAGIAVAAFVVGAVLGR